MPQQFTPIRSTSTTTDTDRRCLHHRPRVATVERLRQFARVYQPVRQLPPALSEIVLN